MPEFTDSGRGRSISRASLCFLIMSVPRRIQTRGQTAAAAATAQTAAEAGAIAQTMPPGAVTHYNFNNDGVDHHFVVPDDHAQFAATLDAATVANHPDLGRHFLAALSAEFEVLKGQDHANHEQIVAVSHSLEYVRQMVQHNAAVLATMPNELYNALSGAMSAEFGSLCADVEAHKQEAAQAHDQLAHHLQEQGALIVGELQNQLAVMSQHENERYAEHVGQVEALGTWLSTELAKRCETQDAHVARMLRTMGHQFSEVSTEVVKLQQDSASVKDQLAVMKDDVGTRLDFFDQLLTATTSHGDAAVANMRGEFVRGLASVVRMCEERDVQHAQSSAETARQLDELSRSVDVRSKSNLETALAAVASAAATSDSMMVATVSERCAGIERSFAETYRALARGFAEVQGSVEERIEAAVQREEADRKLDMQVLNATLTHRAKSEASKAYAQSVERTTESLSKVDEATSQRLDQQQQKISSMERRGMDNSRQIAAIDKSTRTRSQEIQQRFDTQFAELSATIEHNRQESEAKFDKRITRMEKNGADLLKRVNEVHTATSAGMNALQTAVLALTKELADMRAERASAVNQKLAAQLAKDKAEKKSDRAEVNPSSTSDRKKKSNQSDAPAPAGSKSGRNSTRKSVQVESDTESDSDVAAQRGGARRRARTRGVTALAAAAAESDDDETLSSDDDTSDSVAFKPSHQRRRKGVGFSDASESTDEEDSSSDSDEGFVDDTALAATAEYWNFKEWPWFYDSGEKLHEFLNAIQDEFFHGYTRALKYMSAAVERAREMRKAARIHYQATKRAPRPSLSEVKFIVLQFWMACALLDSSRDIDYVENYFELLWTTKCVKDGKLRKYPTLAMLQQTIATAALSRTKSALKESAKKPVSKPSGGRGPARKRSVSASRPQSRDNSTSRPKTAKKSSQPPPSASSTKAKPSKPKKYVPPSKNAVDSE